MRRYESVKGMVTQHWPSMGFGGADLLLGEYGEYNFWVHVRRKQRGIPDALHLDFNYLLNKGSRSFANMDSDMIRNYRIYSL